MALADLQRALASRGFELPIIFLTGRGDVPMSVQAMKQGAVDFLIKPVNDKELLAAIRAGIDKDKANREARTERFETQQRLATLTPREREVFGLVIRGKTNKQAAHALGCTVRTIKAHRHRVMEKMQVQSLPELVSLAERASVVEDTPKVAARS